MKRPPEPAWDVILERVARHRGVIRLLAHRPLAELAARYPDPGGQADLLAETIQRAWLFAGGPAAPMKELPEFCEVWRLSGLGPATLAALERWFAHQQTARTYEVPPAVEQALSAPLATALRQLMHAWKVADGLIVWTRLVHESTLLSAGVLPFLIHLRHDDEEPFVAAADNSPNGLAGMVPGVCAANLAALDWMPRSPRPSGIRLHTLPTSCGVDIGGPSTGLPVLLAHRFRRAGLRVPVLRVAGSGALAAGRTLEIATALPLYKRKRKLLLAIGVPTLVLPEPIKDGWPAGVELDSRLDKLAASLREFEEQLPVNDLHHRVAGLTISMRYDRLDPQLARDELRRLLDGQLRDPGHWLADVRVEALLALAAAECHLGNAPACDAVLVELFAPEVDIDRKYVANALVQQAVALTDLGDYRKACTLCDRALDLARSPAIVGTGKREAIHLIAYGTRGQALTFLGLQEGEDQARQQGLNDLYAAVRCARWLDHAGHPADLPRNVAYVCLWHALHLPQEMQNSWDEAWAAAELHRSAATKSHLHRYRWLGGYRAAKVCAVFKYPPDDAPVPGAGDEFWLRATSLKYRATQLAASGDLAGARRDFAVAASLTESRHPVLRFIGATAALQAGESLLGLVPEEAGEFLRRAAGIFEDCTTWYAGPIAGQCWLARTQAILGKRPPDADPQRCFPY